MPQLMGGFKPIGQIAYVSGKRAEAFNLKTNLEGRYLHELAVEVDMTHNVTTATTADLQSFQPFSMLPGIELRSSKYGPVHEGNAMDYLVRDGMFAKGGEHTVEDTSVDADALNFALRMPMFCPRSANPWASVIDVEMHKKLSLLFDWATIENGLGDFTASAFTADPVATIYARTSNTHPGEGPTMLYTTSFLEKQSQAAGGAAVEFKGDGGLPIGDEGSRLAHTHLCLRVMDNHGTNGLVHDDAAITKFKVQEVGSNWNGELEGGEDMDGSAIQQDYDATYTPRESAIPDTTLSALKDKTGIYPIDFIGRYGGSFDFGILAEGLNQCNVSFTYGAVPTEAQLRLLYGSVKRL